MNGWIGTILRINLTSGAVRKEPLVKNDAILFLGGSRPWHQDFHWTRFRLPSILCPRKTS